MKQLACLIEVTPESGSLGRTALNFAEACAEKGIGLWIFFYGEGVYTAYTGCITPTGEPDVRASWARLVERADVTCVACVTAAERRGITAEHVIPGMRLGGLGEWTDAMARADRVVQFR